MMLKVKKYIKKLKNRNVEKKKPKKDIQTKSKSVVERVTKKKKLVAKKTVAPKPTCEVESADAGKKSVVETGLSEAMQRVTIGTRNRVQKFKTSPNLEKSKKLVKDAVKKSTMRVRAKVSAKIVPRTRSLRSAAVTSARRTGQPAKEAVAAIAEVSTAVAEVACKPAAASTEGGADAVAVEDGGGPKTIELKKGVRRRPLRSQAARKTAAVTPGLSLGQVG
jgi:hypothetical protein